MSSLALLGLVIVIGLLNLVTGLLQWLASPFGLASAFIAANLGFCAFHGSCPPAAFVRNLCTRAGCGSR